MQTFKRYNTIITLTVALICYAITFLSGAEKPYLFTVATQAPHLVPYDSVTTSSLYQHRNYQSLDILVTAVIDHFEKNHKNDHSQSSHKKPMVIFDIDETALTPCSADRAKSIKAVQKSHNIIEPMFKLYNYLISKNYIIAFVTARFETTDSRKKTVQQLEVNGYKQFHSVHMRPTTWKKTIGEWKEKIRTKLAKKFHIVGTFDDKWRNLQGAHTGNCLILVGGVH